MSLQIGYIAGSTGTYVLSGTGSLSASATGEGVGFLGTGIFNQSGGTNTLFPTGRSNDLGAQVPLNIAIGTGSTGTYILSGTGSLSVDGIVLIGNGGDGFFNQSGGTSTVTSGFGVFIGAYSGSTGAYLLTGGTSTLDGNVYVGGSNTGPGGTGTLTVSNTGQLNVTGTLTVYNTGRVNVNGGTFVVNGLSIATGGLVNVNSALSINYAVGKPSPISAIQSYLSSGYNGGAWNGTSIISTAVAALNASQNKLIYSVGYADGADGVVVGLSSGQIEILPTLAGDALLAGDVTFGDFQVLAAHFGLAGSWDQGNFTYGSKIDFGDFQLLAQNIGAKASGLAAGQIASLNSFAAGFGEELVANPSGVGFSLVSVPEPTSACLLAMSGTLLLRRRHGARAARKG